MTAQKKFEAISDLLGRSVDNASEHHAVINVVIGQFERMKKIREYIGQATELSQGTSLSTNPELNHAITELTKKARDMDTSQHKLSSDLFTITNSLIL